MGEGVSGGVGVGVDVDVDVGVPTRYLGDTLLTCT